MAAPPPSTLARPSRVGARLACGGLRPHAPIPEERALRAAPAHPPAPDFLSVGGEAPHAPAGPVPAARIRGQPRVLSGGGCGPHAPRRSGARGADSRAAARSVRGRPRSSRSPSGTAHAARIRGKPRVLSGGGCGPHAPRRSGARGADSRAAARSVRGRLRPSRSPPVRCPRRGFEGSRAFYPGEAAALTLPAGPVPAARIRGQPRVLSGGGCAPHAPRRSGARAAGSRAARPLFSARERATVMVRPLQN